MVNSWVQLYQSTPRAILHIYGDVARGLTEYTRLKEVNPWIELFQTTSNVILHISTDLQRVVPGRKGVIRVNPWVELFDKNVPNQTLA